MTKEKMSFERSITRLDEIVRLLEDGNVPLENALSLFEEGTSLIKNCGAMLNSAEQKVSRLMKGADGEPEKLPFPDEDVG